MKYLILLTAIVLSACCSNRRIANPQSKKIFSDSSVKVSSLNDQAGKDLAWYMAPSGKKVLLKKYNGPSEPLPQPMRMALEDTVNSGAVMAMAASTVINDVSDNDPFKGSIRVKPKTTYSAKKNEKFRTIPALFRKLESNDFMKGLGIGNKEERVEQEDRNVVIAKAFLYTITVEDDNDMHLLIGNTPVYKEGTTRVFNAEIPGVPRNGTAAEKEFIRKLRAKAIAAIGDVPVCGRSGYLQAHRRISISGSLFYDSHHASKPAKCREVEGESAWEIHPVKDISFDD